MRKLILPAAALAALVPGVAWAADNCPDKITPELVTALGDPAATLTGGQTIYQPAGVTALGMPVSYVVVTRGAGSAIEEIDYRFAGVMRKYSEPYPKNILQAFDKAYDGAGCATGKASSCALVIQSSGGKASGRLSAAEINEADIDVPANAQGAALAQVKSDYASDSQGPVFLVCLYDTGS